jgi:predicted dehydrogenase
MSIRIGIIGAGTIAEHHATVARRCGLSVAGFADIVPERARRLAAKFEGADGVGDAAELLARPGVDAAIIAVPNAAHKACAIQALQAGKDVFLEKPMALNTEECDQIMAAMEASRRLLQVGFVCRHAPTTAAARAFIEAGRLGRIYQAKAIQYRRRGIPGLGRWFTTRSLSGGGALIDLGVHLIDLVLHLTGHPRARAVSAACTSTFGSPIERYRYTSMWAGPPDPRGTFDVEDGVCGHVRFEGGLLLEVNITWAANLPEGVMKNGIVLLGDRGGLYFDVWGREVVLATEEQDRLVDVQPQLPEGDAWMAAWESQCRSFAEAVERRAAPAATAAHGRAVQAIIDAMYRSSSEGREVAPV